MQLNIDTSAQRFIAVAATNEWLLYSWLS